MGRICSGTSQREKGGLHQGITVSMEVTPTALAAHPSAHLLFTMHCLTVLTLWKLHHWRTS